MCSRTVSDGTCKFPGNWFGCDIGAVAGDVKFVADDIKLECTVSAHLCVCVCFGYVFILLVFYDVLCSCCVAAPCLAHHVCCHPDRHACCPAAMQGKEAGKCASNMNILNKRQ